MNPDPRQYTEMAPPASTSAPVNPAAGPQPAPSAPFTPPGPVIPNGTPGDLVRSRHPLVRQYVQYWMTGYASYEQMLIELVVALSREHEAATRELIQWRTQAHNMRG